MIRKYPANFIGAVSVIILLLSNLYTLYIYRQTAETLNALRTQNPVGTKQIQVSPTRQQLTFCQGNPTDEGNGLTIAPAENGWDKQYCRATHSYNSYLYGYSFLYPKEWNIHISGAYRQVLELTADTFPDVRITITSQIGNLPLGQSDKTNNSAEGGSDVGVILPSEILMQKQIRHIGVKDILFVKTHQTTAVFDRYFMRYTGDRLLNSTLYIFTVQYPQDFLKTEELQQQIEQIINGFNYLN